MTPLNESDMLVKMLEQTNANIINFKEDIASRLDRIENRQDQYSEKLSEFVTRREFTSTNEKIASDMSSLINEFKQIAEKLTANKITQDELLRRIEILEKEKVDKDENTLLASRVANLENEGKEKKNHKRAMWIAIIGSLSLAIFEFINSHLIK